MNTIARKTEKATFRCHRVGCGHAWMTRLDDDLPDKCPKCKSRSWRKGATASEQPSEFHESPEQTLSRLMLATRDIMRSHDYCAIGKNLEGKYLALTPPVHRQWLLLPERHGVVVLERMTKHITSDDLGIKLFGRHYRALAV